LRRRRRSVVERSQAWVLYVLAAAVAFAAVLGAWYVAANWSDEGASREKSGYLAALELTVPDREDPVAAVLVVQDPGGGDPGVYLIPPDLLLEGPNGEYVFAGDAMAAGTFEGDLQRVVGAPVDAVYRVPVSDLGRWAAAEDVTVELERPVSVDLPAGTLVYRDGDAVPTSDLPALFAATGVNRRDLVTLQTSLLRSSLEAAALRPADVRARLGGRAGGATPAGHPSLNGLVERITSGSASVARFPSGTRTAEDQFAFVPDAADVMAEITRRTPGFKAAVTVQVRNGSGKVGVGEAAVDLLSSLDINLPAPLNADSFSYRQTQILASPDVLPLARDIRAILGRGVVLDGSDLPSSTIEVILGADFNVSPSENKDQP